MGLFGVLATTGLFGTKSPNTTISFPPIKIWAWPLHYIMGREYPAPKPSSGYLTRLMTYDNGDDITKLQ